MYRFLRQIHVECRVHSFHFYLQAMNTILGLYQKVLFTKLEYKCINHFSHELLADYM